MAVSRVTAVWQGFPGAPGYTNIFFDAFGADDFVDAEVARVRSFFNSLLIRFPSSVTISVSPEVSIFDEVSGELLGYSTADETPDDVEGQGSSSYSGPSGAVINWSTDTVNRGRRVRGRTFLVPLADAVYDSSGTLSTAALNDLRDAAEILMGDGDGPQFVVWSRPRDGAGGALAPVTSYRVPDMAAVLRSRRD